MDRSKQASIVIPVRNREKEIIRCLDSIAAQSGVDRFSTIVVDNGSTDMTKEVVESWHSRNPGVDLTILNETVKGAPAARNTGLQAVTTPYVMFFDSDDIMLEGHLKMIADGLTDNSDADILGWNIDVELPDGSRYTARFMSSHPLSDHLAYTTLSSLRFIARTSLVRDAGGWDNAMTGWNDFEIGVRLLIRRPKTVKLTHKDGKPTARTFFSEDSITGRKFSANPAKWENTLDKIEALLETERPDLRDWIDYRRAVLAGLYGREGAQAEAARLLKKAYGRGHHYVMVATAYYVTRVFGRGARLLTKLFLPTGD